MLIHLFSEHILSTAWDRDQSFKNGSFQFFAVYGTRDLHNSITWQSVIVWEKHKKNYVIKEWEMYLTSGSGKA